MKKVELRTMENIKYQTIKKLVDTNGNKRRAALKLDLSIRQINRLIVKYKAEGKEAFVHGNRAKVPTSTISNEIKEKIIELYKTKYEGANFKHFQELLLENESINISYSALYVLLRKKTILSPKVHRHTVKYEKKKIKEEIKNQKKLTSEQKDLIVKNNILDKYEAHSRIPRLKYFGECLEMDASTDYWFGTTKTTLHGAIDNATGTICGLYFDVQETLNGYYHLFDIIWRKYGVPAKFKTDNRTVFIYNGLKDKSLEKDTLTQFGYACNILGVDIETTSVPEKKSRIERLWGTLQSRLTTEFKVANITTIEEANNFLTSYVEKFNNAFASPINYTTSVFEKVEINTINQTLSIISKRVFDKGCSIKYNNKIYLAFKNDLQINYARGTKCLVIKTFDNKLLCNVDDEITELVELDKRRSFSNNFDVTEPVKKERKKYIPPLNHPWKQASFMKYLSTKKAYEDSAYI